MDIKQPFLAAWIATLKDKSQKHRSLQNFGPDSEPFLTDLDTKEVAQFFYIDGIGNKVHGVDVLNKLFMINGSLVQLPLPEGDYHLSAKCSVQISSDNSVSMRLFCFGLETEIDGKRVKYIFAIYPDNSLVMEEVHG